ncbi:plant UBX domain-containing protein 8-like [Pistacia vera]|uniref:plant UBX domain-containing protein 8-like n=1 Tax=Pistacia vera TaxID=55513 RepID=UPI00126364ED|nr:plant UBX domain-containing protein 8-like [Pistacia vera]
MVRPNQEAIDTFISITGVTESVALQKLEEHGGDLNAAVNAFFSEGDRNTSMNIVNQTSIPTPQDDFMEIDDPIEPGSRAPPLPLLSAARTLNPFSLLDPNIRRTFLEGGSDFMKREPFVTQPREVREIPIEVKDGSDQSGQAPTIEDVTESTHAHGSESHGTVIVDEVDEDAQVAMTAPATVRNDGSHERHSSPTAPAFENLPDYSNDIEEEMVRAAIEASKREVEDLSDSRTEHRRTPVEDADLAHAVSLSLKTAEQEKALRQIGENVEASKVGSSGPAELELGKAPTSNGRLEAGSSSIQDEAEDLEEQPLVRHRSRHMSSGSVELPKEAGVIEASSPSSPGQHDISDLPQHNGNAFPDEWGGISSEEHDEAVMLEAAMFGGIPESGYNYPYAPHQFMRPDGSFTRQTPRPPSPSLEAQRLIREQQDDEYLASLQADREKELKAREEAEARRLEEEEARKAALEEEKQKEEETRRKMEEKQEYERQLAAKEASLPQEPSADDENAVTLLVKMPDGSRRGRRFLKSNKLQSLFDFIDVGRGVKAGTYRLVRPYPRRAFSDGESGLTLNELGLTSRQEALFLELI